MVHCDNGHESLIHIIGITMLVWARCIWVIESHAGEPITASAIHWRQGVIEAVALLQYAHHIRSWTQSFTVILNDNYMNNTTLKYRDSRIASVNWTPWASWAAADGGERSLSTRQSDWASKPGSCSQRWPDESRLLPNIVASNLKNISWTHLGQQPFLKNLVVDDEIMMTWSASKDRFLVW